MGDDTLCCAGFPLLAVSCGFKVTVRGDGARDMTLDLDDSALLLVDAPVRDEGRDVRARHSGSDTALACFSADVCRMP